MSKDKHEFVDCKEESDKVMKEEIIDESTETIKEEYVEYYEDVIVKNEDNIDDTVDTDQKNKRIKIGSDSDVTLEDIGIIRYVCKRCDDTFMTKQQHLEHLETIHKDKEIEKCYTNNETPNADTNYDHKIMRCPKCTFTYTKWHSFELHQIVHYSKRPYKCSQCEHKTSVANNFNTHILSHSLDKPCRCSHCSACFSEPSNLLKHKKKFHSESLIVCDKCDFKTYSPSQLSKHQDKYHTTVVKQAVWKCEKCAFIYTKHSSFELHQLLHGTKPPYICVKCEFSTCVATCFNRHILSHTDDHPYQCHKCNSSYRTHYQLKYHINYKHPESVIKCDTCSYTAHTEKLIEEHNIRIHRKNENDPTLVYTQCCHCNEYFRPTALKQHTINYHSEFIIKCDRCAYTTHDQDLFSKHKNRCNSRLTLGDEYRNHSKIAKTSRLTCDKCKFICTKDDSLDLHQIIHSTPKSNLYQCTKCDHETRLVGDFNHHILSHFDDNPYVCAHCNASFTKFGSLKTHVQSVHPYSTIKLQHLYP